MDENIPAGKAADGFDPETRHPVYNEYQESWETTRDVYLGANGVGRTPEKYVPQRAIGEAKESYDERITLLHFSGLLGALIDALVGLWSRKPPEKDEWGALGTRNNDGALPEDSLAFKLTEDADRERTTWSNHRRASITDMLVYHRTYTLIDTNAVGPVRTKQDAIDGGIRPYVKRITPLDLTDWIEVDGRKVEAVIREKVDSRTSVLQGQGELEEQFIRLTLSGWTRYVVHKDGSGKIITTVKESGEYTYVDTDWRPRLPLVEKRLPGPRYAAYNLARIVLAIINHDSYLDTLMRAGALGQFLAVQGDDEDVRKMIRVGDKVLPYPPNLNVPQFVAYNMAAAEYLANRVDTLAEQFWKAAMYEFSDRPQEKTATEVEQEWASGVGAFLSMLSGALQEAENEEKWLLYQAVNPPENGKVDTSRVGETKFAENFRVEDIIGELTRVRDMLFGANEALPMGATLRARIVEQMLTQLNKHIGILAMAKDVNVREEIEGATTDADLEARRADALRMELRAQGPTGVAPQEGANVALAQQEGEA